MISEDIKKTELVGPNSRTVGGNSKPKWSPEKTLAHAISRSRTGPAERFRMASIGMGCNGAWVNFRRAHPTFRRIGPWPRCERWWHSSVYGFKHRYPEAGDLIHHCRMRAVATWHRSRA